MHEYGDAKRPLMKTTTELEARALSFAEFQDKSDPEGILRKGFIEEIAEIAETDLYDKEEQAKEIGDTIWYLMAIAHQRGYSFAQIVGGDVLVYRRTSW